jgi:hypothetical protein
LIGERQAAQPRRMPQTLPSPEEFLAALPADRRPSPSTR